jgi:hypothetical protein
VRNASRTRKAVRAMSPHRLASLAQWSIFVKYFGTPT